MHPVLRYFLVLKKNMKKRLLFIPIAVTTLSVTSCRFDDDEWRKDYGTPELFLNSVTEERHQESLIVNDENIGPDYGFEIKNAILDSSPFENRNTEDDGTGRSFTYQAYYQTDAAGASYCVMDIWDNGYLKITHKKTIGPKHYAYYSISEERATYLNDLVIEKNARQKQIAEDAYQQALVDGAIENFITEMEKKSSYPVTYLDFKNNSYTTYEFVDEGELFNLIKQATFTPSDDNFAGERRLVFNNDNNDKWSFVINNYGVPYVNYVYTDSLDRTEVVRITYSLPDEERDAILDKALQLGKAAQ